VGKVGKIL